MGPAALRPSGLYNFEESTIFFENLCAPVLHTYVFRLYNFTYRNAKTL